MNQENNNTNSPRPNSEQRSRAEVSLKDSLDDVIASLIDLDEDDASEESSASKNLMDTGLQNAEDFDPETARPIVLTERAARQVQKIVEQEGLESGLYLRVAVEGVVAQVLVTNLVWIIEAMRIGYTPVTGLRLL